MKCEACERGDHFNCGMQTWCECDCDGPENIEFGDDPMVSDIARANTERRIKKLRQLGFTDAAEFLATLSPPEGK